MRAARRDESLGRGTLPAGAKEAWEDHLRNPQAMPVTWRVPLSCIAARSVRIRTLSDVERRGRSRFRP